MEKLPLMSVALALSLLGAAPATAADFYPWNNHAAPYTFLFGNDIDTHQQTQQLPGGSLSGFFYIQFTGVVTKDGYPVATHVDCNTTTSCTVGWTLSGKPRTAAFLYQVDDDHPVFLVNRLDIPEPGAYAHFHWLDYAGTMPPVGVSVPGYLLQLSAVDSFCLIHDAAEADAARKSKTCRNNGGIAVHPGIDIATHLNIVASFPSGIVPGI
jgi:hypothetical protein